MPKGHKDLEFAVDDASGKQRTFKTFAEACGFAVVMAMHKGRANLDVLCWSRAAAVKFMGEEGGEWYDEDPDASVFQRIQIRADNQGRVA